MRPLKLTISAFGPYADKQTIDFISIKHKNIFLITGPTGAGKTTIFDAISFVLFGEASGSSRESDTLRSHFASIDNPTYVEMEFEIRGEKYIIKRNPKYERKKSRGEGITIQEPDAELYLPDGSVVTKVNPVDEKISTILGINKNQFRQIVMLPQGEFRKLLEADSKEREVIFRKIFGTEAFQTVQMKLLNLQKQYDGKIKESDTKRKTHITHIEPGEDETLQRLLKAQYLNVEEIVAKTKQVLKQDKEENKESNDSINKNKLQIEEIQRKIAEGSEINKRFKDKEDIEKLYKLELVKEKDYTCKKVKVEKARKASNIRVVEDTLIERKNNCTLKENQHKEAERNLAEGDKKIRFWESKYKTEEDRGEERRKLSQDIATLKDKEQKVKSYEEKCLSIESLRKELEEKKNLCEQLKESIVKEKSGLSKANEKLVYINNCETEKVKLNNLKEEKNSMIEKLKELRTKTRQYLNNLKLHEDESKSYGKFEEEYLSIKAKYEVMEDSFLKGQAGILAKALKHEEPCPVCGSIEHPNPAKSYIDAPSEEELKEAKGIYDGKREERSRKLQSLAALNAKVEEGLKELTETKERLKLTFGEKILLMPHDEVLTYINESGPKLKAEADLIEGNISKLDKLINEKASVENFIEKYQKDLEQKENLLPKKEEEYTAVYGKVVSQEEQLISIEAEIPEEIRSSSKLSVKVRSLEASLSALEKAYKEAQDSFYNSKNEHASLKADKEGKLRAVDEAVKEVELYKNILDNKLLEYGFTSYEEYTAYKLTDAEINDLGKEIEEYYKKLQNLKGSLERAEKDIEELMPVNIEELTKILGELKLQQTSLEEKEKNIFLRIKNNNNALKEIEKINELIRKDEEQYGIVSDLAKAANGSNEEKITFERYVLAAYFDEIISAANLRLNKMTGGRFVLKRKEDRGKYGRQEGLELEVFDNYTGKARHVKTLSGGESFKASLALALGLADVVQAYAGGISLDTMFVDEGFGTLDPESLDHAVQCLIDLQKSGRLVGIISHVPELKERIDVRLEITPAKEGSKVSFVV